MPQIEIDLSFLLAILQRPDIFLVKAFYWIWWFPIASVLIWGIFEIWLFNRQHHYRHTRRHVLLAIDVPKETEQGPLAVEHIFSVISAVWGGPNFIEQWIDGEVAPVFSFELVSDGGFIQYYVRVEQRFRDALESSIYAQYPDAEIREAEDYTKDWPDDYPNETHNSWGCEELLKKPYYLPIRTYVDFEHKLSQELKDPVGLWLEQLSRLKSGEVLATQFLCMPLGPLKTAWINPGVKYIYEEIGKESKDAHKKAGILSQALGSASTLPIELAAQIGFGGLFGVGEDGHEEKKEDPWKFLRTTPIDKERLDLVTKKISKPAMNVKIRHVYVSRKEVYNKSSRDKMLKGVMNQFMNPNTNSFGRSAKVTPKTDYFWQLWYAEKRKRLVIKAYKHRDEEYGPHGNILNIEELATLWHFPSILVKAPFITKTLAKRAEPPVQLPYENLEFPDLISRSSESRIKVQPLPVEYVDPIIPESKHLPRQESTKKAEPPINLPGEPEPKLPHLPESVSESKPSQEIKIPDAVRFLFDPSYDVEGRTLPTVESEEEK